MSELTLRPMTDAEYELFYSKLVVEYAAENVKAGEWLEEDSLELSKKASKELLPEGRDTSRVLILTAINDSGNAVGYVWIGLERFGGSNTGAWIYDIEVHEEYRGKGYGRALLRAAEIVTVENGVRSLGLNVFGPNKIARSLYESAGYEITKIQMSKDL